MALERDAIKCPHCGFRDMYWHDYVDPTEMEAQFELDCEDCGGKFEAKMSTDVWFETRSLDYEDLPD